MEASEDPKQSVVAGLLTKVEGCSSPTTKPPETAMDKVRALLDARQPAEAIAFADACEGDQPLVTQVRALACTHGGTMLRDRELIERGAWLWMQAGADKHPGLGYNLSNAHLDLWDLAVAEHGFVVAI